MKKLSSAAPGGPLKKGAAVLGIMAAAAAGAAVLSRLSAGAPEWGLSEEDDDFEEEEIPGKQESNHRQ